MSEYIGPFFVRLYVNMEDDWLWYDDELVPIPMLDWREFAAPVEFDYGPGKETPWEYECSRDVASVVLNLDRIWHNSEVDWLLVQGWRPEQTILIRYWYWWAKYDTDYGREYDSGVEWEEIAKWGGWSNERIANWLQQYEFAVALTA